MGEEGLLHFKNTLEYYHKKMVQRRQCREIVLRLTSELGDGYETFLKKEDYVCCSMEEAQAKVTALLKKKEENTKLQEELESKKLQLRQENIDFKDKRSEIVQLLIPGLEKVLKNTVDLPRKKGRPTKEEKEIRDRLRLEKEKEKEKDFEEEDDFTPSKFINGYY
jgi:hypothetical protein